MARLRRQKGAVLVLAMVVLILVSSLAVTMAAQLEQSARQGANRLYGGQAREYVLGAESLGLAVLARDSRMSDQTDHLAEDWARRVPEFPVEGGWVRAGLADAQGRINLNGLAQKARGRSAASGEAARFTPAQRRFIRLLQTFEEPALSLAEAIALTEAVIDWLDADDEPSGFGGAEADHYLRLPDAYRPGNGPMADISELRLVRYVTAELYQQLQAYVVALPEQATLNINSAPVAVMQTINRQSELLPSDRYAAQRLVSWRDEGQPFTSLESFLLAEQVAQLNTGVDGVSIEGLSVRSDYFLLRSESEINGRYRAMSSLILRDAAGGRVIQRSAL